jgi:hypothetical protein
VLKRVADAGKPLYQNLSDTQKRRFGFLSEFLRPRWRAGGEFDRGSDEWSKGSRKAIDPQEEERHKDDDADDGYDY